MTVTQINLEEFEKLIEVKFSNIAILKTALTHRSFLNETHEDDLENNERLEFLGDAVLELITTQYLFENYPHETEGNLTSYRAALVRTESLAETAETLQIGKYLLLSKGEEITGGRSKPFILANTFEALLGAIYLDQGIEVAKLFVQKTLMPKIHNIVALRLDIDSKSKLQEIAQEQLNFTPSYVLVKAEGPDHDRDFTMAVVIHGKIFGEGTGKSKQIAEQEAAENSLKNWDTFLIKHGLGNK